MDDVKKMTEQVERISGVDVHKCMRCGKCSATCPNYDEMEFHPHEFVYMVERGKIRKLMDSKALYTCLSCFACIERCPRQVEPAKLIEATRMMVEREKGAMHLKPEMVAEKLDDKMPQQAIVSAFRKYKK